MSNRANSIVLCLVVFFVVTSCNNEQREANVNRKLYFNSSLSVVGADEYFQVYTSANDSIEFWVANGLETYLGVKLNKWQLDSLICFNTAADKCIMALIIPSTYWNDAVQDNINFFNGVKIKNQWYFFKGGQIVLPREYYQKDIHTPLSFEKLHEIAMKEVFSGYLKENPRGKWEVNEHFFDGISKYDAYNHRFTTQESYEESVLRLVRANWEKRN